MGILKAGGRMHIGCRAGAAGDMVAGTAKHPRSTEGSIVFGPVSRFKWNNGPLPIHQAKTPLLVLRGPPRANAMRTMVRPELVVGGSAGR